MSKWLIWSVLIVVWIGAAAAKAGPGREGEGRDSLGPRGRIHIPIGIANTLDTLKTFVEAEGNFSPGVGSYGVYFWVFDKGSKKLVVPTMDGVKCEHGLAEGKHLIPWSRWKVGDIEVATEVCEVQRRSQKGDVYVAGSRASLENKGAERREIALYVALRPIGAAGFDVKRISVSTECDALLVEGHPAIVADRAASDAGVVGEDAVGEFAMRGEAPKGKSAVSQDGNCSGALRFDLAMGAGEKRSFGFVCPVLAGRRAVGHKWDGVAEWAQFDLAELNPSAGGELQPDGGLEYYRKLDVGELFAQAKEYWKGLAERVKLRLPDERWEGAFCAIIGHAAMEMNEGAPDVAVVNYNVFNRDGVYVANIFQKSGNMDLAVAAIDYFMKHPFNGRSYPEADNPGQVLWAMGQQWRFGRDKAWVERVWPAAQRIAEMIRYYRTTGGPHWVEMDGLRFGDEVPKDKRRELQPGRCDGFHPEYTEAFDIAGLQAAVELAEAVGKQSESAELKELRDRLLEEYDKKFGGNLGKGYGSYSVLWPCRLYSGPSRPGDVEGGKGYEQFKGIGEQQPGGWRYFALATAHQGLLAGNREAGYGTLEKHLEHEQMRGWYAFDEGGKSGSGGWGRVRTTWNGNVAMPHGWAIAEVWLLLRDCLLFEDGDRLVLFGGVRPEWFKSAQDMEMLNAPTYFGDCSVKYSFDGTKDEGTMDVKGTARPAGGFVLRLPAAVGAMVTVGGRKIERKANGDFVLPGNTAKARIEFSAAGSQIRQGGKMDWGVVKLSATGALLAGTLLGGSEGDNPDGIHVDSEGNLTVFGQSGSRDFPVWSDAYQSAKWSVDDAVIVKLSPNLDRVIYSTFLGGDQGVRTPGMKHGLEARATRDGRSPQAPHEEALGPAGDTHATVGMSGGTGLAAKR